MAGLDESKTCGHCHCAVRTTLWTCLTCKWNFCNCRIPQSRTHVVYHAALSRHTSFKSFATQRKLQCTSCQQDNIYLLRRKNDTGELWCREHCGAGNYTPIVKDDALIFNSSSSCTGLTISQYNIKTLEHFWETGEESDEFPKRLLRAVPARFRSCREYSRSFRPLVLAERNAQYEKLRKEFWCLKDENMNLDDLKDYKRKYQAEKARTRYAFGCILDALDEFEMREVSDMCGPETQFLLSNRAVVDRRLQFSTGYSPCYQKLNLQQKQAVLMAMNNAWSLVQGPPGTGKTTTAAAFIVEKSYTVDKPILVCTSTNIACDVIALQVLKSGLEPVRMYAESRLNNSKNLAEHISSAFLDIEESEDFQRCRVICCTFAASADKRLDGVQFSTIVIDEAGQAIEPAAILPIIKHGAETVAFFGDHFQLSPVVLDIPAGEAGLSRSIFERLIGQGFIPSMCLTEQYRMHPSIRECASYMFYGGRLTDGKLVPALAKFSWPNNKVPICFYNTTGSEERGENGFSYINLAEARILLSIVQWLVHYDVLPEDDIAVVTPYSAQRKLLEEMFSEEGYKYVETATVDAFQGREKCLVLFSCVRSNNIQRLGFLSDWNRLNVAITRAIRGLILVGNAELLATSDGVWRTYIQLLRDRHAVTDFRIEKRPPGRP